MIINHNLRLQWFWLLFLLINRITDYLIINYITLLDYSGSINYSINLFVPELRLAVSSVACDAINYSLFTDYFVIICCARVFVSWFPLGIYRFFGKASCQIWCAIILRAIWMFLDINRYSGSEVIEFNSLFG